MTDRRDIEETLKDFRHEPGGHVKHAATGAYRSELVLRRPRAFWRRPIPLYAAAAALAVMVALSFVAGRHSAHSLATAPSSTDGVVTSQDVEWSPATSDLL